MSMETKEKQIDGGIVYKSSGEEVSVYKYIEYKNQTVINIAVNGIPIAPPPGHYFSITEIAKKKKRGRKRKCTSYDDKYKESLSKYEVLNSKRYDTAFCYLNKLALTFNDYITYFVYPAIKAYYPKTTSVLDITKTLLVEGYEQGRFFSLPSPSTVSGAITASKRRLRLPKEASYNFLPERENEEIVQVDFMVSSEQWQEHKEKTKRFNTDLRNQLLHIRTIANGHRNTPEIRNAWVKQQEYKLYNERYRAYVELLKDLPMQDPIWHPDAILRLTFQEIPDDTMQTQSG